VSRTDEIVVGVGGVIWDSLGRLLLIRRTKPPRQGEWSLPGGKVELGETLETALHREIREETGLTIAILGLAGVAELVDRDALPGAGRHYVLVDYGAKPISGIARAASDASHATWFSHAEIAGLPMWEETRRIIDESARLHRHLAEKKR
jgi:8-oxo-dGTP diphosphatase